MIETKTVSKKYDKKTILEDITIDLPKGKTVAFIGSNGVGKSTLLSIISRTLKKNSGEVYVEGKELAKWDSKELSKKLSVLKQSNVLNIRLTIKELVSFGRFPYSRGKLTKEDQKHVKDAIDYMGLEPIQDRYLDELSGGQKQMAFIAMVIAQDTEYILLDEPLNNLDMKHSVHIMKILKNLVKEKNKTVIVVIHDINFVSIYADYIIALKDSKVIIEGNTEDIMKSDELKSIYDMDIQVENINGNNICVYYT